MTAFIFHCHDIDWLSSLVPGLFLVVSFSSDVTSPGDKAGIAPILNQAEVSTRTCKVLFSWFSTLDNGFLTFLFYSILFYFFFFLRWVDHFARHMGGGEGEEPWSWPVEMFSVETIFEGLPVLGALHVCKNCPNCQKKGYFRANSDLSYNGMPNSLSNHFLQLRDFYFQTVKLGSVNQQAWIRGKASILSAAKNNSKRS